MSGRIGLVTLALATLGVVGDARAAWDTYGVVSAGGGYTDNALSVAEPQAGDPDAPRPEADAFAQVRPSLIFLGQGPRSRLEVSYVFTTEVYQRHEEANSYTNQLRMEWLRLLSPQTDIRFVLTGLQGERSAFQQGGLIMTQVPAARLRTFEGRAEESIEHQLESPWTFRQLLAGTYVKPFGDGSDVLSDALRGELVLEMFREFRNQRWGALLGSEYALNRESRMGDVILAPGSKFLINRALATHQRSLTDQLELTLALGVMQVADGDDPAISIIEPAGTIGLLYQTASEETILGLEASHGAGANTYTGDVALADSVNASIRKELLPDSELVLTSEAGYTFARNYEIIDQEVADRADMISVIGTLVWVVEDSMTLGLEVTLLRQSPRAAPMTGPVPVSSVQDLRRNTVIVTLSGTLGTTARRRATSAGDRTGDQRRDLIDGSREEGGDGHR